MQGLRCAGKDLHTVFIIKYKRVGRGSGRRLPGEAELAAVASLPDRQHGRVGRAGQQQLPGLKSSLNAESSTLSRTVEPLQPLHAAGGLLSKEPAAGLLGQEEWQQVSGRRTFLFFFLLVDISAAV